MNRYVHGILVGAAGCGLVWLAARASHYGWTLFLILPTVMGFGAALNNSRPSAARLGNYLSISLLPLGAAAAMLLMFNIEGAICIAMAAPIAIPLALLGGYFAWLTDGKPATPMVGSCVFVLVPLSFLLGPHGPSHQMFRVTTSIVVNARPALVWKHVVSFPDLAAPVETAFRAGIAFPLRTEIDGSGVDADRRCVLSTGTMTEKVTVWEPNKMLRFAVTSTPPPMKEMTFWQKLDAPHLHGFYQSSQGEFALTALPGGRTRVDGTSWYRHGLEPAQYWRLWTDYIVHKVHRRVLDNVKRLAEDDRALLSRR